MLAHPNVQNTMTHGESQIGYLANHMELQQLLDTAVEGDGDG